MMRHMALGMRLSGEIHLTEPFSHTLLSPHTISQQPTRWLALLLVAFSHNPSSYGEVPTNGAVCAATSFAG